MKGENPLVERDFAILHDCANCDREWLIAFVAPTDAGASALAGKSGDACRVGVAAMAAHYPGGPIELFKVFAGLLGIGEHWV